MSYVNLCLKYYNYLIKGKRIFISASFNFKLMIHNFNLNLKKKKVFTFFKKITVQFTK